MAKKLMLIDGNSILNRAYYGVPLLTDSKGRFTNGVFGFLNTLMGLLDEEKPDYLGVAFDMKAPTFRHKTFTEYKGTRHSAPDELKEQFPLIREVLKTMDISIFEIEGFEADDILGTLSLAGEKAGFDTVVVSGDMDLLQIASKTTKISIPKTRDRKTVTEKYFEEDVMNEFGVTPTEFIDVKALMGDASDNVPGVPKIGKVTALKIISEFKSVENAIANVDKIKGKVVAQNLIAYKEQAELSKYLVTIVRDVPVEYDFTTMIIDNIFNDDARNMVMELGFKSLVARFNRENGVGNESDGSGTKTAKKGRGQVIAENQLSFDDIEKANEEKKLEKDAELAGFTVIDDEVPEEFRNNSVDNVETEKEITYPQKMMVIKLNKDTEYIRDLDGCNKFFETLEKEPTAYYMIEDINGFVGISLYQQSRGSVFIEVCHENNFLDAHILNVAKVFFENPEYEKIGMDIKKDITIYRNILGVELDAKNFEGSFDVMIATYVINPLSKAHRYNDVAGEILNEYNFESWEELLGKGKKEIPFNQLEEKRRALFAFEHSRVIFRAKDMAVKMLEKYEQTSLYYDMEYPLIFVLADMEKEGICVDETALVEYQGLISKKVKELNDEIIELAGQDFNVNSPKQLGEVLFENLKLEYGKKTKSKTGYSTAVEVLEKLKGTHPIIEKVLEYRHMAKLKSTYAEGLLAVMREDTKKIHSTFNQTITATGRISSTEPNLQNIPTRMELGREIRKCFIPSNDQYCFLDADYSQIELRVLACMSEDETLINAFNENQDIHTLTASQVFHIPFDEVTSIQRRNAKAVNFGIIYGMGAFSLAQDLGISRDEADAYIQAYFKRYPKIKAFLDGSIKDAKTKGYAETLFKRRRNVMELRSSNFNMKSFGERVAMNMPIQGTAADIIKIAMIRVHNALKDGGYKSKLILQVHDELLIETHLDEEEEVTKILKENMEQAVDLVVKLKVDLHRGETWYDVK